jgi:hypothetical protein
LHFGAGGNLRHFPGIIILFQGANSFWLQGLKLFLDYSHVQKKSYPTTLAKPAKAPPRSEPVHYEHFDKESSWLSNPVYVQTAVVAATVVVVGITLGYVLRRSN